MMRLKLARIRCGWSQAELARRAALNPNTISQIENYRWKPYAIQLAKLARALGMPEADAHILLDEEPGASRVEAHTGAIEG